MNQSMMLLAIFTVTLSVGCNTDENNQKLVSKIDSLSTRISQLEEHQVQDKSEGKVDSVSNYSQLPIIDSMPPKEVYIKTETKSKPNKTKIPEKKLPLTRLVETKTTQNDTIYYFYKNSKEVSVKITPWQDQKRKILLYDPYGRETYSIEDTRHSYTSTSEINSFHSNGAVDRIDTHLNPGASMYWYKSSTTFEINNQPLWQTNQRFPSSLEDYTNNASYWDNTCKCWKKQEVSKDDLPPMRY